MAETPGAHRVISVAGAAALAAALVIAPAATPFRSAPLLPVASAACPDAEVIFARGRQEPPGVGAVGDALVNALRSRVSTSVGVYGVNYPADLDPGSGADDISAHVRSMAKSCPNTRLVLGGYSIGATAASLAARAKLSDMTKHIAAIALFGNASNRLGPAPAFAGKTVDQCANGDPICGRGLNWDSHLQPSYLSSGLVEQAAGFIAGKL